jgi:hypothetical protein
VVLFELIVGCFDLFEKSFVDEDVDCLMPLLCVDEILKSS